MVTVSSDTELAGSAPSESEMKTYFSATGSIVVEPTLIISFTLTS